MNHILFCGKTARGSSSFMTTPLRRHGALPKGFAWLRVCLCPSVRPSDHHSPPAGSVSGVTDGRRFSATAATARGRHAAASCARRSHDKTSSPNVDAQKKILAQVWGGTRTKMSAIKKSTARKLVGKEPGRTGGGARITETTRKRSRVQ